MSILIQDYELSVWEQTEQSETKLAIIGDRETSGPSRAQELVLKRNINGEKTLTFSLFYEYQDDVEGNITINPFCSLLTNGRKLKLKWKNKWYEFSITNIVEDSETKKISYTAKDSFITELSKKGFNIELSTELENNQGTIIELGKKILEQSDWEIDEKNSKISPQTIEEVLVEMIVSEAFSVNDKAVIDSDNLLSLSRYETIIPKGVKIYGFYSTIYKKDSFFQFYYKEDQNYEFNEEDLLINCPLYSKDDYNFGSELPENIKSLNITTYKGKRLIRTQQSYFDNILETYVKVYQDQDEQEIIGYTKTEYIVDNFVRNLVTNSDDFISDIGWYDYKDGADIEVYSYPEAEVALSILSTEGTLVPKTYIKISPKEINKNIFYNTGFEDNKNYVDTLYDGQRFVIRMKYGYSKKDILTSSLNTMPYDKTSKKLKSGFKVKLCSYKFDVDGYPYITNTIFETSLSGNEENVFKKDEDYWTAICRCNYNFSKNELNENYFGFFFEYENSDNSVISNENLKDFKFYLEDCQIFEYKERLEITENNYSFYLPGETPSGKTRIKYNYFYNNDYTDKNDISYFYQGYQDIYLKKKYYDNYIQIRSIEGKESNIYNLIQSLCETFECWADFIVEHDELGYITKNAQGNFVKKIVFRPYIGKEKWSGFQKGINLKKINRTINSDKIATKTIVKANSNEFAPNGFCTIAYAEENPSGESFIYDFRFYENKGLIDSRQLRKDLYGNNGLYPKLKKMNNNIDSLIEKQSAAAIALVYAEKEEQVSQALVSELSTLIADIKKEFKLYSGITLTQFFDLTEEKQKEILELAGVAEHFVNIVVKSAQLEVAQKELKIKTEEKIVHEKDYKNFTAEIKKITKNKEKIILDFETKYTSYIHEGSWISEDYIDHNLYYIDAKAVAATSSVPQVSYTNDVIDVSSLEDYFNYNIDIGDKTYIIDPDFFGYIYIDGLKTPKKQQVVISEITENLEEPDKNKIVVQNYKTQFDDLFQRITAASQQLQLNSGSYLRAANAFSSSGLSSTATQNSLNNINFLLENNTIKWNADGFITTNQTDKRRFLKIHNGSIFLTEDGGVSWNAAISGKGINANYIYAGQLDAGKINIVSELKTNENQQLEYALTLDRDGLSMYSYEDKKQVRVRLGKILEDGIYSNEIYGLQLYNKDGKQTFKTDSDGNITMSGTIYASAGSFSGAISAASGNIGGWVINTDELYHQTKGQIDAIIATSNLRETYEVNNHYSDDWRLLFGIQGMTGNFGVTSSGNLYANGVDIKDGNISFGDIFKITTNGKQSSAGEYGLNIQLNPENENEQVVIESDDRVIGIRERLVDENGEEIRDSNGKPQWTWKTILGDLTNATLGGKPVSDYGIDGYGLCTENGLFSGTIVAGNGKISGFQITDTELYNISHIVELEDDTKSIAEDDTEDKTIDLRKVEGLYLSSEGRFKLGGKNNYIIYDDINGSMGLEISVNSLKIKIVDNENPDSATEENLVNILKNQDEKINSIANPRLGYSFTREGLIITTEKVSNEVGDLKTKIDEKGMIVSQYQLVKESEAAEEQWTDVLVADDKGVSARNLHANTYLIVGSKSRFETYEKVIDSNTTEERTACYWLGG